MCRLAKQESNKANLRFAGENICYHVAAFYDHILTPPSGSGGGGGGGGEGGGGCGQTICYHDA